MSTSLFIISIVLVLGLMLVTFMKTKKLATPMAIAMVAFLCMVIAEPAILNHGMDLFEEFMFGVVEEPSTSASEPTAPAPAPAPSEPMDWTLWLWIGGGIGVVGIIAFLVSIVNRKVRASKARKASENARVEVVMGRIDSMEKVVNKIRDRLGEVQSNVIESLELYALLDTKFPETERFWAKWIGVTDKLADARRSKSIPDGLRADVDAVERAWKSAYANAERMGLSAVGDDREDDAGKAIRSVRLAEGTSNRHEAALAWQRAASLLASLNLAHLPEPAMAAVESGSRLALTDGADLDLAQEAALPKTALLRCDRCPPGPPRRFAPAGPHG